MALMGFLIFHPLVLIEVSAGNLSNIKTKKKNSYLFLWLYATAGPNYKMDGD